MRRLFPIIFVALTLTGASTAAARTHHRPAPCHVPNVKGDTLAVARHKIIAAHCKVGTIDGNRTGTITAQVPKAGRRVKHGTKVTIRLAVPPTPPTPTTTTSTTPAAPSPTPPPPPPAPTLIPTSVFVNASLEVQNITLPYYTYFIVNAGLYYGSGSELVGQPVTFSITDATTQQTVATFPGTSNAFANCTIVMTVNYPADTIQTFTGQAVSPYAACALGSVSVPAADVPLLGVSFAGDSTYAASSTAANAGAPL